MKNKIILIDNYALLPVYYLNLQTREIKCSIVNLLRIKTSFDLMHA